MEQLLGFAPAEPLDRLDLVGIRLRVGRVETMEPLGQRLLPQGLPLRELDPRPTIHTVEQREPRIDLNDVFLRHFIPDAVVDERAEIGSSTVRDFDDGGCEVEQRALQPLTVALARAAADGLEEGIAREPDDLAGAVDPGDVEALLPDIEVVLGQTRTVEDESQPIDGSDLLTLEIILRAFPDHAEQGGAKRPVRYASGLLRPIRQACGDSLPLLALTNAVQNPGDLGIRGRLGCLGELDGQLGVEAV